MLLTHKYMQCKCPLLFYFGSENDYLNLENMSTNGPLNSRQGRDHFFGMSASMWRKRESSLYPQASLFLNSVFRNHLCSRSLLTMRRKMCLLKRRRQLSLSVAYSFYLGNECGVLWP